MERDRLFLGYETAFLIWRKAGPTAFSVLKQSRVRSLAAGVPTQAKVDSFRSSHPDLAIDPLDVIVEYGGQRIVPGTKVHVRSKLLPDRSFYKLGDDDVYVASPELCLMQLATKLTEPQVVKLALEMCASYAIDPYDSNLVFAPFAIDSDDSSPGISKRPPLTDAKKLESYAARLLVPGSRAKSAHFLRYIADGSASPRETALLMLFCMPPRYGGYGFELPELNRRIELTHSEQLAIGVHHFDCDFYWPHRRVAVEYDSTMHHTAEEKQERDAIRRNMLQYKGVRVITATRLQVNNAYQFDKLARQVARAIGKRLRIPEKEHIAARDQLRKTLFSWDINSKQLIDGSYD